MKNETSSQRILKWLRANKIPLGALTSHDTAALLAATEIANLWVCGGRWQAESAEAFELIVNQMQVKTQFMAYHAIAMVGDWHMRSELWTQAHLPIDIIKHAPKCEAAPAEHDYTD